MARTVAVKRELPKPGPYRGVGACGFCITRTKQGVRHDLCPVAIGSWLCQCAKEGHPG